MCGSCGKNYPNTLPEIAKDVFRKRNYHINVIENSKDVLEDVCALIEENEEFKKTAWDVVQLIYVGHGIHKVGF